MAEGMIEVAKATVTIIPNMQGSQQVITKELTGQTDAAAKEAGNKGGKSLGDNIAKGMGSVGGALTKGITAPVAAAATASVAAWHSVDKAMDTITVKTGASGKALEDMQNRAKDLATTLPVSFEDAGTAIGEVNTRFGLTGGALEDLSGKFLKFSKINGTDVNSSIDMTQKALAAFGLSADDAGVMLDSLNVAGQQSGIPMETLTQDLMNNASAFQGMGMSAADSINALAGIEKSGIDVGTAMSSMSRLQKQAAADGVSMSDELTRAISSPDEAVKVFGRNGVKMFEAFQSGQLTVDMFSGSTATLDDNMGSVADTFDATQDPLDQVTVLMNQLKDAGAQAVDALGPLISDVLTTMVDVVKQVADAWSSLSPSMQEGILKAILAAAAIGPLLAGFGKVIDTIKTVKKAFGVISGVMSGFAGGSVVLIVAAIAAAVLLIVTHLDEIKAALKAVHDWAKQKIDAIEGFFDGLASKVSAIKDSIVQKFTDMKDGIGNAFQAAKDKVSGIVDGIHNKVTGVFGALRSFVQQCFENIKYNITHPIEFARDTVKRAIDAIKNAFNFKWSLPKLTLPHFSVSGGKAPWGFMGQGSLPNVSVKWYAQAAQRGAIFDRPQLIGVGDASEPEALLGVGALDRMINSANRPNVTINVYGAPGQDENALAERVMYKIQRQIDVKGAVFA